MAELGKSINAVEIGSQRDLSAWGPLREPLFRALWTAAVVSYSGTWMQNVGAGWLMTSLTMSPFMVGLVQAASSLPVFLVILPAGALADIVDRRRLLLVTQSWMVLAAAALGVLTLAGMMTPWMLLGFTFLLGIGAVMNDPAWQAITPEVVSRERFHSAVALNSAGFNVARAIGPALGGVIIAAASTGVVFLLNAASFAGVIYVLHHWRRPPHQAPVTGRRVLPALRVGFQYLRQSPAVRSVMVRTAVFSFAASSLLALLPLIARPFDSVGYGTLLSFFGLGALAGAVVLPPFRRSLSLDALVVWATVLFAITIYGAGALRAFWALAAVLLAGGAAWITILSSLNVSAQTMSPAWVRARMLSMYLLTLQGGMAAGSATWGAIAARWGISTAMLLAALALLAGLLAARRFRLQSAALDVEPSLDA